MEKNNNWGSSGNWLLERRVLQSFVTNPNSTHTCWVTFDKSDSISPSYCCWLTASAMKIISGFLHYLMGDFFSSLYMCEIMSVIDTGLRCLQQCQWCWTVDSNWCCWVRSRVVRQSCDAHTDWSCWLSHLGHRQHSLLFHRCCSCHHEGTTTAVHLFCVFCWICGWTVSQQAGHVEVMFELGLSSARVTLCYNNAIQFRFLTCHTS